MSSLNQPHPSMTADEFLAWEEEQAGPHEYIDGEVVDMSPTLEHSELAGNLLYALRSRPQRANHLVVRMFKVRVDDHIFYPDLVVVRRPYEPRSTFTRTPVLLAEVSSPWTEYLDTHIKWPLYQSLPSLRTFLLVHQDRVQVQLYRRSGAAWTYTLHQSLADVLELSEPALTLPLRELYAGVDGLDPSIPAAS